MDLNTFELLLLTLFLMSFIQLFYFYVKYFFKLARFKKEETLLTSHLPPISLIIAVKNEKQNLMNHLPLFAAQQYPNFEIIIVDDHSIDGTKSWIEKQQIANLRYYQLSDEKGKKAAIEQGIKNSKYDSLLLTDADCRPSSEKWMKLMASNLKNKNSLVLGYGKYEKKSGLLNALIRFETIQTAIQYFSFALCKKAYMGVGRNLAYQKSLFFQSSSFSKYKHIRSGDDDLFVNEIAEIAQVEIELHADSHTISKAKDSWKSYFFQKRRHLEAGSKYKQTDKIRLMKLGLSLFLFWICFILLCTKASFNIIIFSIFAIKLILQYYIYGRVMYKLKERDLIFWIPLLELFYLVWMLIIGVSIWIWKVERWK